VGSTAGAGVVVVVVVKSSKRNDFQKSNRMA
jgi:hypothetical protein